MSFDISEVYCINRTACLNPFGTGQCLSTTFNAGITILDSAVSIPLEQGNVFRQ